MLQRLALLFFLVSPVVVPTAAFAQAGQEPPAAPPQESGEQQPADWDDTPTTPAAPVPEAPAPVPAPANVPSMTETNCTDRNDDDGDGLVDCADADCFGVAVCEAGGQTESNDTRCSDWIDNDGDGAVDCDDSECHLPGVTVCEGSAGRLGEATRPGPAAAEGPLPKLEADMTPEDLIGAHGDADGERNDFLCSDGVDNDNDGRTDCADFGCRFDPTITVCANTPSLGVSVVAGVGASYDFEAPSEEAWDVRFTRIQLRLLGQIPLIEDSFFLLSMRAERTPRLTFAHFQVPIGSDGHYAAINSGQGSLSAGLVVSVGKNPLLDPPFYVYNAFEQGAGAAVEFGGPLTPDFRLRYRVFAAGGSGESNGNVGGRFFRSDDQNFAWLGGAQIQLNILGYFDRFDNRLFYEPLPLTLGLMVGGKYDQRPVERYPAGHSALVFRYSIFSFQAEGYAKRELEFDAWQFSWNAQLGLLIWPKHLFIAGDIGSYYAEEFQSEPEDGFSAELPRPLDELQFRGALHWYFYKRIGILTLLYTETHHEENPDRPEEATRERELLLHAQFRF